MFRSALISIIFTVLLCGSAVAQSACSYIYYGAVLTPAQWAYCFEQKQDVLNFTPLNKAGDTMNGTLVLPSASTDGSVVLTPGSVPSAPSNGAMWVTSSNLWVRLNGSTVQVTRPRAYVQFTATSVDFNTTADTPVAISLPLGYTRYLVHAVYVSNASTSLTTATAGLFTAASGGGAAVVTTAALSVSSAADATNNNAESLAVVNADTESYTLAAQPTLYFRVETPEGVTATADVTIILTPLP